MPTPRLDYASLGAEGLQPMRALEHYLNANSGLGASLLGLVRLAASRLNGCAFCIGLHTRELQLAHEPAARIESVLAWRDPGVYTERERAALAWAEAVTNIQKGHAPEPIFDDLRAHFSEKEIVDLTLALASVNAWNRLAISFGAEWKPRAPRTASPALAPNASADAQKAEA